jgi:hypothetical protein
VKEKLQIIQKWGENNMVARALPAIFFFLVLMALPCESSCESLSSNLDIKVRVLPFLEYKIIHEQCVLFIKQSDIKKGYVEVNDGLVFSVSTNNPDGYILWMSSRDSRFISFILIMTEYNKYYKLLPGESIEMHMPYRDDHHNHNIVKVSFKIYLKRKIRAGVYPWPIVSSIHPL